MEYEELIRDTDALVREVVHRNDVISVVMCVIVAFTLALLIRLLIREHRIAKASKKVQVVGGKVYVPVVTDDVQIINGVEFRRMGVPERRE